MLITAQNKTRTPYKRPEVFTLLNKCVPIVKIIGERPYSS